MTLKSVFITVVIFIISVAVLEFFNDQANHHQNKDIRIEVEGMPNDKEPTVLSDIPQDAIVNGSYIDSFDNLESLVNGAKLIAVGSVISQESHPFGLSIISKFSIKDIIKGDSRLETIDVLQLKDSSILQKNQKYVLFLGEDADWYYVIGAGVQGIFGLVEDGLVPNAFNQDFFSENEKTDLDVLRKLAE